MFSRAALLIGIIVAGPATAQAFGVRMGAPVREYGGKRPAGVDNPYYFSIDVPKPNGEFESYSALATPQTGICKVSAIGKTHENDAYGTEAKSAFSSLRLALRSRYGPSEDFDFIRNDALWDEPREWVWSIYKEERSVASFWTKEAGASLPAELKAIALDVNSVSPTDGAYLSLSYEFTNFDECKAVISRAESRGL